MKTKNKKLNSLKKVLHDGMLENFKRDGYLAPTLFFFKDDEPSIALIPQELLSSVDGKNKLADIIKKICKEPTVIAAGIIIEAHMTKVLPNTEMEKSLMNGSVRVSQLKEKQDIILMHFSTPVGEEMISYVVDYENKTVGERFGADAKNAVGIFTKFFEWNRN